MSSVSVRKRKIEEWAKSDSTEPRTWRIGYVTMLCGCAAFSHKDVQAASAEEAIEEFRKVCPAGQTKITLVRRA
jgi:hypothetical protein